MHHGGVLGLVLETIDVEVVNDIAHALGRLTFTNDEGESLQGYYMWILKRENGEWKIHRQTATLITPEEETTAGEGQTGGEGESDGEDEGEGGGGG